MSAEQYQDPRYLAQATTQLHQQQPGLLSGLLGGGGGGGNALAKAALAGIAATAVAQVLGGGGVSGGTRYRIGNLASRKLLPDPQGSRDNGTKIIQWDDDGRAEQQWQLDTGPHGGARLRNAASGKLLANPQGSHTQRLIWRAPASVTPTAVVPRSLIGDRPQACVPSSGAGACLRHTANSPCSCCSSDTSRCVPMCWLSAWANARRAGTIAIRRSSSNIGASS